MGEHGDGIAARHAPEQLGGRGIIAARSQYRGGDHGAAQEGLEQQAFAAGTHDTQGLQRAKTQATLCRRHIEGQHAELSQSRPGRFVPTRGRGVDGAKFLERVLVGQITIDRIVQLLLLVAEFEVHGEARYRPTIILEIMFF